MNKWWSESNRVIQTNLQISDAETLDAEKLAARLVRLHANALVFNVGGIYAWYPTQVPYHTINPLLKNGRDIVKEVVEACRKHSIRFIARYDFSKAVDQTYREHPEWFVRLKENQPQMVAVERFGNWPQLVSTCLNGGYQNEEVAFRVLRESMEAYDPDAIFVTSMIYAPCNCEKCKAVYRKCYGKELPQDPCEYETGFAEKMMDESVRRYENVVHQIDPEARFLHRAILGNGRMDQKKTFEATRWWFPRTGEYDLFFEHSIDWIHGETHDTLSNGRGKAGSRFTPGAAVKLMNSLPHDAQPLDIVHTAPGLAWRHTGLPAAEHRFWASQVPANGGQIWHSLTGIPDGIVDREQLESVEWLNWRIELAEPLMNGAKPVAPVALLWNDTSAHGWIDALTTAMIPYEIVLQRSVNAERLASFQWVVVPQGMEFYEGIPDALAAFVQQGGHLLLEGRVQDERLRALAGILEEQQESEYLTASYLRVENETLQQAANLAELVPLSGRVYYTRFSEGCLPVASLVPPFAPPEGVGSPPERAILPQVQHRWPMIVQRNNMLTLTFSFHELIEKFGIPSHYRLLDALLTGQRPVRLQGPAGLQLSIFHKENHYLIHVVNGIGERPLQGVAAVSGVVLTLALKEPVERAVDLFTQRELPVCKQNGKLVIELPPLDSWQVYDICVKEG